MTFNEQDLSARRIERRCISCGKQFTVPAGLLDLLGDMTEAPLMCNDCFDREMAIRERENRIRTREAMADLHLSEFELPENLRQASFDNFIPCSDRQLEVASYAREFASNDDYIFAMLGKTGNGKSHLAVAMLREWCTCENPNCCYVTEKALFDELLEALSSKKVSSEQVVEKYIKYQELVIDEIGRSEPSAYKKENLLAIVTGRLDRKRKTVIIGNLTSEAFKDYFPDAVISRMSEGGRSFILKEEDYRRRK